MGSVYLPQFMGHHFSQVHFTLVVSLGMWTGHGAGAEGGSGRVRIPSPSTSLVHLADIGRRKWRFISIPASGPPQNTRTPCPHPSQGMGLPPIWGNRPLSHSAAPLFPFLTCACACVCSEPPSTPTYGSHPFVRRPVHFATSRQSIWSVNETIYITRPSFNQSQLSFDCTGPG